jgi:hypothetical protein
MYRDETNQQGGRKISKKKRTNCEYNVQKNAAETEKEEEHKQWKQRQKQGHHCSLPRRLHNNRLEPQPQQQHHHHRGEHRPRQERNAAETGRRQKSTTRGKPSLSSPVASASTTANQTSPPRRVASSSPSPSLNAVAGAALHCSRFKFSNILPGPTQFLKKKIKKNFVKKTV